MTFFWQQNPRVKAWVQSLLENKDAIGKAIKAPLRDMLGCGHWGCVFNSRGPWVVKLTIDPNEAPIWEKILGLIEEEHYGQGGIVRVKGIYHLEPGVIYGGRKRRVYAIVREEVEPVFMQVHGGFAELSKRTKMNLYIPKNKRAFLKPAGVGYAIDIEEAPGVITSPENYRVREFLDTFNALNNYRMVSYPPSYAYGTPLTKEQRTERAQRATYGMSGGIGGALGETLQMLASNGVVLRDVHIFNIGWRTKSEIAGHGIEDKTLVVFDPGHTPVGRTVAVPTVRVKNPWAPRFM